MRRGELWWAELPEPIGGRPVLLLSRDRAYLVREYVMVAPVCTRAREIPAEVPLGPAEGLPRQSVANLDSLVTVPKAGLRRRIGSLSRRKLRKVEAAIHFALGLDT